MQVGLRRRGTVIPCLLGTHKSKLEFHWSEAYFEEKYQTANPVHCGQSYKHFTIVIYDSRVVIWANL